MPSTCYAIGCVDPVRLGHLMCYFHWRLVPKAIQVDVNATFVTWSKGKGPLTPYLIAREKALIAVAEADHVDPVILVTLRQELKRLETGGKNA